LTERRRTVLLLQGPTTLFWNDLADALTARGCGVRHVSVCFADWLFWRRPGGSSYRGSLSGWGRWLDAYIRREGVTDILYFADRHPYHRIALKRARRLGVEAHAIEFGYLRPNWLTLEREAGGAFSHFPADPAALDATPGEPPNPPTNFGHSFLAEAFWDVAFNLADVLGRPLYPRYWSDRYYAPIPDYMFWLAKLARSGRDARAAATRQQALFDSGAPFWLAAMQLESDYMRRHSSPYAGQMEAVEEVLTSFAAHAPADARIVFKTHPFDNGRERFPARIKAVARRLGVEARVISIHGGDLGALVRRSQGVVTINSTVGMHTLRAGKPLCALAPALYAMPGLTHHGGLDTFWTTPEPPDTALVEALVATLGAETQIAGSFHTKAGRLAAADAVAARLAAGTVGPSTWRRGATPPRLSRLIAARAARR
jgi:capsular polysaccharide export protein